MRITLTPGRSPYVFVEQTRAPDRGTARLILETIIDDPAYSPARAAALIRQSDRESAAANI